MTTRSLFLVALPLLVTCNTGSQTISPVTEVQARALGTIPPSEVAVWRQVGTGLNPDGRFLQAAALDEKREVVVLFGGATLSPNDSKPQSNQELWVWSPATGQWSRQTGIGTLPSARAGASLAYDSTGDKFVLFGGRSTSGVNYEDTWEWDPASGAWTDRTGTGPHPSARSQHGMVYQKSTGKILLFGGSTSTGSLGDWSNMSASLKDVWEYDPTAHGWTDRTPSAGPSARHDFGLVWDGARNRAILFGGLQISSAGAAPVPKQDIWEWDPSGSGTWTDRTAEGLKPSPRYAHSMAYDGYRKKIVLFGGWNIDTSRARNDLWDWDPMGFTWTQRLSGNEAGIPAARLYASLVTADAKGRLELLAGAVQAQSFGVVIAPAYYASGSNEVWELEAATPTFTDRTSPQDMPSARSDHAMAYNPSTRRVYLFGGHDNTAKTGPMDDLWEWDGKAWTQVVTDTGPPGAYGAGLAYDPVRKSLILYGGMTAGGIFAKSDTWEWNSDSRRWTPLSPSNNPGPAQFLGMVTDTTHGTVLLFGSQDEHVWEWDGRTLTWTDRTPLGLTTASTQKATTIMAYDEGRQRLFLYEGWTKGSVSGSSASGFWEWDPVTAGWLLRDPNDGLNSVTALAATYDSIRRRIILLPEASSADSSQTWELDAKIPQWYQRKLSAPSSRQSTAMAFDSDRGVAVLFGGMVSGAFATDVGNDTWEYKVTNLGNGEGCNATFATLCASGNCVDGVCCETAACTGSCKSCNVPGSEGICKLAAAGTVVPGSCENGNACDGAGTCKSSNGQVCSAGATCASGFCVNGICCDSTCTGICVSCSLSGRMGTCSPRPAGTDPDNQCVGGTGLCKSTCDGAGACGFPAGNAYCDSCHTCDGTGQCSVPTGSCPGTGGTTGSTSLPGTGGMGGSASGGAGGSSSGGVGGSVSVSGGAGGSTPASGGVGGSVSASGGAGGSVSASGGAGGSTSVGGSIPASGGVGSGGEAATGGRGGTGSEGGRGGSSSDSGGTAGRGGSNSTVSGDAGQGGNTAGGSSGSAGGDGSLGRRDGGSLDAGNTAMDGGMSIRLSRTGCSCSVGQAQTPDAGWFSLFALVGAGWLAQRLRRRPTSTENVAQTQTQLAIPGRKRGAGQRLSGC